MTIILKRIFQLSNQYLSYPERRIHCSRLLTAKLKSFSKMTAQKFQGIEDRYHGVIVDSTQENCNLETFPEKLEASLNSWQASKKHGIWFKVALEHTQWVPVLAKNGFDFHHAKNGYVMMFRWLPSNYCGIPPFAHTNLAVGALVINDKSEILVVKEKHFLYGHWKFPGGTVEPGENLIDAAQREVLEETNIKFEFKTLVSLMHANKGIYDCSDFYILVAGNATTTDIKKCEREIADCKWVDIDEYLTAEDVTQFNKDILKSYLEYKKNNVSIGFTHGVHKLSKRDYMMYNIEFNK